MIRIATDAGDLDLFPSTTIEFNLNSPLFSEDGQIKGDYALDFTIPFSDGNAAKLGAPQVIENSRKFDEYIPVKIFLENLRWLVGNLKIKSISSNGYNVNITSGLSDIGKDLKEKKLADVVDKAYNIPVVINDKFVTIQYIGSTEAGQEVTVTVFDKSFEDEIGAGESISTVLQRLVAAMFLESGLAVTYVAPDKIKFVQNGAFDIEQDFILDAEGFKVHSSFMTEFNNQYKTYISEFYNETPLDDAVRYIKIHNTGWAKELKNGIVNIGAFFIGNTPSLNRGATYYSTTTEMAPYPYLRYIFASIETALNITFEGDFIDDPDFQKLIQYCSESVSIIKPFVGPEDFIFWRTKYNLSELVPDYKINEYLKRIAGFFNLSFEYNPNNRRLKLLKKEEIIKATAYTDITNIASPYTDRDLNTEKGITLGSKKDVESKAVLAPEYDPYLPYIIGDGEKSIEIECAGLEENTSAEVPAGSLSILHAKGAKISPKLIFFAGISTGLGKPAFGSIETENYSLSWHGEKGMYEKWWKSWARFEQRTFPVKFKVSFGIAELLNLDWSKKYRIDRVNYLLKSVRVVATMRGLKIADVEAYKT